MTASKRVLLVDDEPEHLLAMQMIFEQPGKFEVVTAGSAEEADQVLDGGPVDVIVLDIALPGETGLEFAKRLRKRPYCEKVPVVAITAYPDYLWRDKAFEAGCDAFVNKPFEPSKLTDLVDRLTGGGGPGGSEG